MGFLNKLFGGKDKIKPSCAEGSPLAGPDTHFDASHSGDFNQMMNQLYKKGKILDTHFLYLNLIDQAYARRKEPEMRTLFMKLALEHIEMFDRIRGSLIKSANQGRKEGTPEFIPHVPTFQHLATVYTEDGEYEKAIEVCEKAIAFGLSDWTKSGYQGRIERVKKKMK